MPANGLRTASRISLTLAALAAMLLGSLTMLGGSQASAAPESVPGIDVSGHQENVNWQHAWNTGARFAYVKATEGTGFTNSYFSQQYKGAYDAGMIRGAYHFARPDVGPAAPQADYFVANGGGWSGDGKTLPPLLDMEYNPNGSDPCYGLSQGSMVQWIKKFSDRIHAKTGRKPMIYTTTSWWKTCTGNSSQFGSEHPLFIARYNDRVGELPNGWGHYTLWQYSDQGPMPGDQNTFNGSMAQLKQLARGEQDRAPEPKPEPEPEPKPEPEPSTPESPGNAPEDGAPGDDAPDSPADDPANDPANDNAPADREESPAPDSGDDQDSRGNDGNTTGAGAGQASGQDASNQNAVAGEDGLKQQDPESAAAPNGTDQLAAQEAPKQDSGQAQEAQQRAGADVSTQDGAPQELAETGAEQHVPRMIVFAAAMIVLGLIVLTLTRAPARARR